MGVAKWPTHCSIAADSEEIGLLGCTTISVRIASCVYTPQH
jgi:hypothetical protein